MKTSAFFKGLSWLIFLNLLVKPVWIFLIDRQVQNAVGHEEYGRYFAVLNLSFVLYFLSDAGLSQMINQRIASGKKLDVLQLLRIKAGMLIIYFLVCCFVGWISGITQWTFLLYVLLIQSLNSVFILLRSLITAHQFFGADAWFSVLDKTLMTLVCGAILYTSWFGSIDLILFLQVQASCTALAVIAAFVFLYNKGILHRGDQEQLRRIITMILPFAIIIMLMSVHYRLDGFLLERIHPEGPYQAGIYASAYRLLDAANMIGYLVSSFLVPFVAKHRNDNPLVRDAVIQIRHPMMLFAIGISVFAIMFGMRLQQLLYHSTEDFHTTVIQLCIAALPGYFLVHIYGAVLTAVARFRQLGFIHFGAVVVNLLLNLILIPSYGAVGCCIAAIVSQSLCGLACMMVADRSLKLSVHVRSLLVYGLVAGLLVGFFYFARRADLNVWLAGSIAACLTILVLVAQMGKKFFVSLR